MRYLTFITFFAVVLSIYTAGNYYVFIRGYQALTGTGTARSIYTYISVFLWLSFILSRFSGHTPLSTTNHILTWIGSFWLVALLYLFFAVLVVDLARLLNIWLQFLPLPNTIQWYQMKIFTFISGLLVVGVLLLYGHLNALNTHIKHIQISTSKSLGATSELKVALVTDIHLGTLVGKKRLEKLVRIVNQSKSDIVLIAGDILDEAQYAIVHEDIGAPLRNFNAPLGVFAIPGNHEYIGGIAGAAAYISSLRITLLKDSVVNVGNFYLIGRDDIESRRFAAHKRKDLASLCDTLDAARYKILLDHQPYNLSDAVANHIDLQVSGHTHHGQFWPFNYLTKAIFELSWGHKIINNTHIYVSSGYGTWGPPVRIGNHPEVVLFTITSK